MGKDLLFNLSKKDEKRFEEQAKKLTEEEVLEVMTKFGKKLEILENKIRSNSKVPDFLPDFVKDLKFAYEMVSDSSFDMSSTSKGLLIFALFYFIAPIDLIPDFIPVVGYLDDASVLYWALKACGDEVERYRQYRQNLMRAKKPNTLLLQKGSPDHNIIICSGFLSDPHLSKSYREWIKSIRFYDKNATIHAFLWDTKKMADIANAFLDIVPKGNPFLQIGYKIGKVRTIWKDAVINTSIYSTALATDITNYKSTSKRDSKITLIGHSMGARLIFNALGHCDPHVVDNVFTVGGAVGAPNHWINRLRKIQMLVNCYSKQDKVLSYLYRAAEVEVPIGMRRIGKNDTGKRIEKDCSKFVRGPLGHTLYAKNGSDWLM